MILVVDDMPEILIWLSKVIEGEGYYVDYAIDGLSALYKASRLYYSLALIDIILPNGIDGNELARKIKELPEPFGETPLVAMTGGQQELVDYGLFVDTIQKPFLPRNLRSMIEKTARPPIQDLRSNYFNRRD